MNLTYATLPQRIGALARHERQTRFSGGVIGAYWAYLTPLMWIAFVVVLFDLLGRVPPIYVAPEIFVATGILPYLMFRQTVTSLSRTLAANRYLLYVRPVSSNDLMLATIGVEAFNMVVTAGLVFAAITVLFGVALPVDPGRVIIGLGVAWMLGAAVGRVVAILGMISDSFARAVPILLRPLFWLSGIFYTATEMPGPLQQILWFSPLFHATEIVREGYFLGYASPIASMWYPLGCAAGLFVASTPLERFIAQRRMSRFRL